MLVLPATVAAVYACRDEAAAACAAGGRAALVWLRLLVLRVYLPMLVAFVVASPFVVLDAPHFLSDFRRQSQIMDRGWLGFEHVGNGFWYNVTPNLDGRHRRRAARARRSPASAGRCGGARGST